MLLGIFSVLVPHVAGTAVAALRRKEAKIPFGGLRGLK